MAFLQNYANRALDTIARGGQLTPKQWANWLIEKANHLNERERKQRVEKLVDYYFGNQIDYLTSIEGNRTRNSRNLVPLLLRVYPQSYEELRNQIEINNIVKMVIDQVSVVYKDGAIRQLVNDNGEPINNENEVALWEWLSDEMQFSQVVDTANRFVNLTGTVLIRPLIFDDRGTAMLDIITPDRVDVVPYEDDPTSAAAVYYSQHVISSGSVFDRDDDMIFHYWDDERYIQFTGLGYRAITRNEDQVNPYGILPFARFQNMIPHDDFFNEVGDELVSTQEIVNMKLTEMNYITKMQSFSVPVLSGYNGEDAITVTPGRPIVIPSPVSENNTMGDFKFESPSPKINELREEIAQKVIRLARSYGLSEADFSVSGSRASGISLQIQGRALTDRWAREVPYYEASEKRLFEVIKRVWNYHSPFLPSGHKWKGVQFSEDTRLLSSINRPNLTVDPYEMREDWMFKFSNGLATPIDYYMEVDHLTRAEAEERYIQVQEWKNMQKVTIDTAPVQPAATEDEMAEQLGEE